MQQLSLTTEIAIAKSVVSISFSKSGFSAHNRICDSSFDEYPVNAVL
jgi:hypothetical protein